MENRLYLMDGDMARKMQVRTGGFDKEATLQKIIRDNPNLLARPDDDGNFKELFLISQEYPIKESEEGERKLWLDHLLVDEDGIPVLVEVKRSTDTRIKREVIAQMLDYASRISRLDINTLRKAFNQNNPNIKDSRIDDAFFDKVSANLSAEHFRMVFVADEIPDTLRVLIEFLDRSMKEIEVYGVELKPYITDHDMLLVASVIGNSVLGSTKSSSSGKRATISRTIEEFREEFRNHGLDGSIGIFDEIYTFAESIDLIWTSGSGEKHPAYLAKMGKTTIFRVVLWDLYSSDFRALVEFDLAYLSDLLGGKDDLDSLQTKLANFPDKNDTDEYLINSGSHMVIDMNILGSVENRRYFMATVTQLVEDLRYGAINQ